MMPDPTKKYKLIGLTFKYVNKMIPWVGCDDSGVKRMSLNENELAYQIEQGNAVEVREPREFKTTGYPPNCGRGYVNLFNDVPEWVKHTPEFEVTIREVLK